MHSNLKKIKMMEKDISRHIVGGQVKHLSKVIIKQILNLISFNLLCV